MTINIYETGQKVRCSAAFTVNSVATDPTTVTCKVKDPSGNTTTYVYGTDADLKKLSTGNYYIDVTTDEKGEWFFRFEGTGTCVAVEESSFRVRSAFI
jgi:uncharacterized protein YfaS (alpha-2-macroglobulin family)